MDYQNKVTNSRLDHLGPSPDQKLSTSMTVCVDLNPGTACSYIFILFSLCLILFYYIYCYIYYRYYICVFYTSTLCLCALISYILYLICCMLTEHVC